MSFLPKFIDLSHNLSPSTQIYPGDPSFSSTPHAMHGKDGYAVQRLSFGTHTGTHIDAPYHFLADGKTIEDVPLHKVVGGLVLIDLADGNLRERQKIRWEHIAPHIEGIQTGSIVLINTGWSKSHYGTETYLSHPYLAPEVAHELLAKGVRVVGTDTLNPDETPGSDGKEGPDGFGFHQVFLGADGIIAENLTNLEELAEALKTSGDEERWIVSLIPLKLVGADGSPVRACAFSVPK
ncbi:hypothetical protein NLJ89_g9809 [Agrocybe chaxingu]|uniref:Cyclase n=1 Tax=Agrocybe chaxingu TaxID=84603 RepID=A0A9W8JSB9_9AGAR|nr:hypothetical protein NLJ89_g9809 [Agrocybe chaxingu]